MDDQQDYWDRVAFEKSFSHPIESEWLERWADPHARVIDFGCGYGRLVAELTALGWRNVVGVDTSERMIERGRQADPSLDLRALTGLPSPEPDGGFDLALLFAVLTCIPADDDQDAVMDELRRLVAPGGLIYVSDLPLQTDARNQARYEQARARFGVHGVFETDDGAIVRHFAEPRLRALLAGFEPVASRRVAVMTMNGHGAEAIQFLARRV